MRFIRNRARPIPVALSIVSYLFLAFGLWTLIDMAVGSMTGRLNFNFGILGIWIFGGLRRYSRGWRTCALLFTWLYLFIPPIVIIYYFFGAPAYWQVFGHRFGSVSPLWSIVIAIVAFILALWQYWVLTRPDISRLFYGVGSRSFT
jgi:hypothetical protein